MTTELVPSNAPGHDGRALAFPTPDELSTLLDFAERIIGSGILPKHLTKPGDVIATIIAGRELGLPAMVAVRSIHIVNGNVVIAAQAQLGLAHSHGFRHRWIETTDKRAEIELSGGGLEPGSYAFSIDDAKVAGLTGRDNWKKHPAAMLRARAISTAIRAHCPAVASGCYTADELSEPAGRPHSRPEPSAASQGPVSARNGPIIDAEEVPDRNPDHHNSFDELARRRFMADIADRGWGYADLCAFLEWCGGSQRPSAMSNQGRTELLSRLDSDEGRAKVTAWEEQREGSTLF